MEDEKIKVQASVAVVQRGWRLAICSQCARIFTFIYYITRTVVLFINARAPAS